MDLGVVGESHFEVKVKGKTLTHHLANGLEMSYNAGTRRLFSITLIDNLLVAQRRVLLLASSTTIIQAKFTGHWDKKATYVATVYNPRTQFVFGGPAMVGITEDMT